MYLGGGGEKRAGNRRGQTKEAQLLAAKQLQHRDSKAVVKANDMKQACAYMESLLASNRFIPQLIVAFQGAKDCHVTVMEPRANPEWEAMPSASSSEVKPPGDKHQNPSIFQAILHTKDSGRTGLRIGILLTRWPPSWVPFKAMKSPPPPPPKETQIKAGVQGHFNL